MRWSVGAAIVAWAAAVVVAPMTGHPMPWWLGMLPWLVLGALVALRVLREAARPGAERPVRHTLAPGGRGLDEVQGIQLGRPPGLVVTYGDDEPTTAELVVPRTDPLDAGPWTVAHEPDGTVVVESGGDVAPVEGTATGATGPGPRHPR